MFKVNFLLSIVIRGVNCDIKIKGRQAGTRYSRTCDTATMNTPSSSMFQFLDSFLKEKT